MPGTNLTRDEAADPRRPPGRHVVHHRPRPHRLATRSSRPPPCSVHLPRARREHLRRPGRRHRPRDHAQRRALDAFDVYRTAGSARRPAGRQRARVSVPSCPTATPARACTASSTRPTSGSTSTRQFEVPDARRVFTTFEQPDLKSVFTFNVTAPVGLEGRLQRADAGARGPRRTARSVWRFPATKRMSTYITALVAGEYHEVHDVYEGKHGTIPLGHYCRQSLVEHLDRDELIEDHQAGLRVLRGGLRLPLPVRASTTSSTCRSTTWARWRTPACVTLRDEYLPRSRQDALVLRVPRLGDPARDGAHVVRRPGHHEVVGRPLAQRVLRRVGLLPRARSRHRVHRVVDRLHQRPQELGAAPGPAALDAPDRGRQPRPRGRRGQLRRHHLRQGRLGAQAAGRLGRARRLPGRPAAVLQGPRSTPTPSSPTCSPPWRSPPAASSTPGPRSGCRPSGVNTLAAELRARRRRRLHVLRRPPDGRAPTTRRCAGTASASASTTTVEATAAWCAATSVEIDVEGDRTEVAELVGQQQPDLLLLNDGDLDLRQDPPRRALAGDRGRRHAAARRLAGPRAVLGRRVGHDPRRRDVARPTS